MATEPDDPSRHISPDDRDRVIEEMGDLWDELVMPRIEGRIVGYLMLSNAASVSSAELIEALDSSPATISVATRRLTESGFIRKVTASGRRGHHFRVDEDIWGAFLAGERKYLDKRARLAEHFMELLGPDDHEPLQRVTNMRDYMQWLTSYHRKMLADWEEFKRERDSR